MRIYLIKFKVKGTCSDSSSIPIVYEVWRKTKFKISVKFNWMIHISIWLDVAPYYHTQRLYQHQHFSGAKWAGGRGGKIQILSESEQLWPLCTVHFPLLHHSGLKGGFFFGGGVGLGEGNYSLLSPLVLSLTMQFLFLSNSNILATVLVSFFPFNFLLLMGRSLNVPHCSPIMTKVGCTNSQVVTLIKTVHKVFVIHWTCPTRQMQ